MSNWRRNTIQVLVMMMVMMMIVMIMMIMVMKDCKHLTSSQFFVPVL